MAVGSEANRLGRSPLSWPLSSCDPGEMHIPQMLLQESERLRYIKFQNGKWHKGENTTLPVLLLNNLLSSWHHHESHLRGRATFLAPLPCGDPGLQEKLITSEKNVGGKADVKQRLQFPGIQVVYCIGSLSMVVQQVQQASLGVCLLTTRNGGFSDAFVISSLSSSELQVTVLLILQLKPSDHHFPRPSHIHGSLNSYIKPHIQWPVL